MNGPVEPSADMRQTALAVDDEAITAFIEARLAEDAAIAQAAADAGAEPTWEADRGQVLTGGLNAPVWLMDSLSAGDAPVVHAARHDPARVLREVEAKRALLALVHQEDGIASADEAIKYEWDPTRTWPIRS